MLKVRVIPTLLWKAPGLVKGIGFDSWRRVGPVLPAVRVYNARDVDELVLVDIMASRDGRVPDEELVGDFADECFVPLTVGGGIRTVDQIARLLAAGADKVTLNTTLYASPDLGEAGAKRFGSQCIVGSVDVRATERGYRCVSHSGAVETGRKPLDWARELVDRGVGELLLTSVDRDGTMKGYDLDLVAELAEAVSVPVIASGGAGCYQHMIDVVREGGASAVAAASIFHYTELTPAGAKAAMAAAGIPVRRNFVEAAPSAVVGPVGVR